MSRQFYFDPIKLLPGDTVYVVRTGNNFNINGAPTTAIVGKPLVNIIECVIKKSSCSASRANDVGDLMRNWNYVAVPKCQMVDGLLEVQLTDKSVAFRKYVEAAKWIAEMGNDYANSADGHGVRQRFYGKFKKFIE